MYSFEVGQGESCRLRGTNAIAYSALPSRALQNSLRSAIIGPHPSPPPSAASYAARLNPGSVDGRLDCKAAFLINLSQSS